MSTRREAAEAHNHLTLCCGHCATSTPPAPVGWGYRTEGGKLADSDELFCPECLAAGQRNAPGYETPLLDPQIRPFVVGAQLAAPELSAAKLSIASSHLAQWDAVVRVYSTRTAGAPAEGEQCLS